jgi:hypothetical protein
MGGLRVAVISRSAGYPDFVFLEEAATPANTSIAIRKHRLDKRAIDLIRVGGDDEALLNTAQTAIWPGASVQCLEIGRSRQYGPPFLRLGPRQIRHHRGSGRSWLLERTLHRGTAEYATAGGRPQKRYAIGSASLDPDASAGSAEPDIGFGLRLKPRPITGQG